MRLKGKKIFNPNFKTKIFIRFFILTIAVSIAFTAVFIQHQRKALSDALIKEGLSLASLLAYNSRLGVFSEDASFLEDPIEGVMRREDVTSVSIFTLDGRPLSAQGEAGNSDMTEQKRAMRSLIDSNASLYLEKPAYFEFWAPIISGGGRFSRGPLTDETLFYEDKSSYREKRVMGFVKIDIGKNILRRNVRSLAAKGLLVVFIFLMVGAVVAFFMARNVTRPLKQLTEGVKAIEEGRPALPVLLSADDEIGRLTKAFNTMAEALKEREDQLHLLTFKLSLIEEKERRRIANDLHDNLGQTLAVSKMKLGALKKFASSADTLKAVDEIRGFIDEAIRYTRSLTSEISPPVLNFGFVAAVEWLAEQFQERHGIPFEFRDDGEQKPMNEETQILLFRMTRELLFNIVKHAQAHKARVSISKEGEAMRIVIEDNGVGFDASAVFSRTDSFGFHSIRERLKYLGGRLEVQSEPGKGTKVILLAQLKQT